MPFRPASGSSISARSISETIQIFRLCQIRGSGMTPSSTILSKLVGDMPIERAASCLLNPIRGTGRSVNSTPLLKCFVRAISQTVALTGTAVLHGSVL